MEEHRRRLERTQLKIYAALLVLLFGGLLILPWISQVIWIAFIMAIYIRLIVVITRKEELLEKLDPRRETKRAAWYEVRERRIAITDYSDGT
jgi:predicted lysophospholipase L1 biosynthesis ABC-type transport system permease subunit